MIFLLCYNSACIVSVHMTDLKTEDTIELILVFWEHQLFIKKSPLTSNCENSFSMYSSFIVQFKIHEYTRIQAAL